jgi:hypothetical protein
VILAFSASQAALNSALAVRLRAPETAERLVKSAWPARFVAEERSLAIS